MPESPMMDSTEVLRLSLYANGAEIDDAIQVRSVSVTQVINKIPYAKIVLLDGDLPNQDFPLSNDDDFKPGSVIKIDAGYGDSVDTIFEGIIVKQGIKFSSGNDSNLILECRDKAVAMTIGRRNANYVDNTDGDIISTLISNHSGLSADVDSTSTQHAELVQYYCSDWDFMLSRAEANGLLVCIDAAKVSVKAPDTSAAAELKVSYGYDLIELNADMDARSQLSEVTTVSWDPAQQAIVEQQAGPQTLNKQGDLDASTLAEVVGLDSFRLQTPGLLDLSALTDWANSQQLKAGLARIRGSMKFQGSASAKIGGLIELSGVGEHFNGNVFVSGVTHRIDNGTWVTETDFGMSPDWFAEQRDLVAPSASGLLPGVEGLQIGVVMKLDEDPNSENRIQVSVPVLQAETEGVWARLANFHASSDIGAFFIPEIGDEVVLGYLNNDPCNPVILGSLYSSSRQPPYAPTADNFIKAIVTRSELKIEFDDENMVTTIITPGENKIVLSDDDTSILIQDQNDNKIELNASGITLDSPKDINISAKGKINIDAMDAITISSKADVSVSGLNVEHSADVGFTAKGNASAELSASGNTTVKGAMVMIN